MGLVHGLVMTHPLSAHPGGRLVFFLPATPETYREEELPVHPVLQLVENTEQPLTSRYSRRLLTMVKTARHDDAAAAEFKNFRASFTTALDQISELVYSKVEDDADQAGRKKVQPQPDKQKFRGKVC